MNIQMKKPNSQIDIEPCDYDAFHGIRSYRCYDPSGKVENILVPMLIEDILPVG